MKHLLKLWPLLLTMMMCAPSPAHAQAGVCSAGKNCSARTFTSSITTNGARAVTLAGGTSLCLNGVTCSVGIAYNLAGDQLNILRGATGLYLTNSFVEAASPGGFRITPWTNTVGFTTTGASLQVDSMTNRAFYVRVSPTRDAPSVDFGGAPHFVLQQRSYNVDMNYETTTAEWWPKAPRVGASVGALTFVDAAAAGTSSIGSSPNRRDYRRSNTTATLNSISSFITTPFLTLERAPRWCQRVRVVTATSMRTWVGMSSLVPSADTPGNQLAAFRFSTAAADTTWKACSVDSIGGISCVDTGVVPDTTNGNLLCVDCREGTAACTYWVNGLARTRKTTNLPTSGVLAPVFTIEALSASARSLDASHISTESN